MLVQLVDQLHVLVRELLHAVLGAVQVVGSDLAVLLELLQLRDRVAAHVAQRDPALLGELADDLDEILAALLGELRDGEPDDLAVVRRGSPRSDSRIARSISLIAPLSYGWIESSRGSGTLIWASWFSGVLVP